jgi:hypothetical protein
LQVCGVTTFGGSRVLDEALEALGESPSSSLEVTQVGQSVLVLEGWGHSGNAMRLFDYLGWG